MGYKVRFEPSGREIELSPDETILQGAMSAGVHINASCGGSGTCGKCKVKIVKGETTLPPMPLLQKWEIEKGYRLACMTKPTTDIVVEIPIESQIDRTVLRRERAGFARVLSPQDINQLVQGWTIDPTVFKRYLELTPPTKEDNMSDLARIYRHLKQEYGFERISADFRMIKKMSQLLRDADWKVTVTMVLTRKGYKLINLEPGNTSEENYSVVIDIGTTTIFGQLLNLHECKVFGCPGLDVDGAERYTLAIASDYNPQISYGEDVISRIVYALKPGGLERLQEVVVRSINKIIKELLKMANVERKYISHMVIAGNTTMTQLFLGLNPKYLREDPYVPTANFLPPVRAINAGIELDEHVHIYIFPMVASYIGGDIVSGVLGSGIFQREDLTLFMDIGTNGEIVLGNKDWLMSASCSAGPAFEGGGIKFGMRATRGAIEQVRINPATYEPMLMTIGRAKAKGICGSGLIYTVAELLETGALDQNGKFRHDLPTNRVRKGEDGYEYVLSWAEENAVDQDITLTEIDIDNLIRAKGAIYAGCKVLLDQADMTFNDLDRVIIAGGFGHYIDLEAAKMIGLLPDIPDEKFMFVGNGSLLGARLLSFSKDLLKEAENIANMMTNIELSNYPRFMDEYVAAMFLPHTDESAFPNIMRILKAEKAA